MKKKNKLGEEECEICMTFTRHKENKGHDEDNNNYE